MQIASYPRKQPYHVTFTSCSSPITSVIYIQGGVLGEYNDICTQMSCKSDANEFSYKVYSALMGTTCGDGKVT